MANKILIDCSKPAGQQATVVALSAAEVTQQTTDATVFGPLQAAIATALANGATLTGKAQTALTTNATYLAIGAPSVAQNTAQVQALTRQMNALIRLSIGLLDSTTGT